MAAVCLAKPKEAKGSATTKKPLVKNKVSTAAKKVSKTVKPQQIHGDAHYSCSNAAIQSFIKFDTDQDGFISKQELTKVIKRTLCLLRQSK